MHRPQQWTLLKSDYTALKVGESVEKADYLSVTLDDGTTLDIALFEREAGVLEVRRSGRDNQWGKGLAVVPIAHNVLGLIGRDK